MTDDFDFPQDSFVLVGEVAKAHGLRGEIKIFAYSDEAETLLHYPKVLLIEQSGELSTPLNVEKSRIQGKAVIMKLESIDDRNGAEALQGMGILVDKEDLQEIGTEEYYWFEFYGLPVFTDQGKKLGKITSVFSNGAQDIMVVEQGKNEFLIPILDAVIKEHTSEKVVITPPPGLLELNAASID